MDPEPRVLPFGVRALVARARDAALGAQRAYAVELCRRLQRRYPADLTVLAALRDLARELGNDCLLAEQWARLAHLRLSRGAPRSAVKLCLDRVAAARATHATHILAAEAHLRLEDRFGARLAFNRALRLLLEFGIDEEAARLAVRADAESGTHAEHVAAFARAFRASPGRAALGLLQRLHESRGDRRRAASIAFYDATWAEKDSAALEAITLFRQAARLDPALWDRARPRIAALYERLGQADRAAAAARAAGP